MSATPAEKTVVPINEKNEDDTTPNVDLNKRLASVQELLFGDAQREILERLDHGDDRHRDLAESAAMQFQQINDAFEKKMEILRQEIRAIDRAQTAKRRKLVDDLGDAIKAMAYDA